MITATGLTKKFDDITALDNLTCSIGEGCIYGLVGSNGAGKSTFLRLLAGIYKPDSGIIQVDGMNTYENPQVKSQMVFVPDDLFFLRGASMNRMAKLYAACYPQFDRGRFERMAKLLSLDTKRPISTFSKGMRRQAATLLALAVNSRMIFFDETFDGLDPVMRNVIKRIICEEVLERGCTAIITSHSLRELEDTCDQLALMHEGGIVLESEVSSLKTSLFKVQIAFRRDFTREEIDAPEIMEVLSFTKSGSVATLIVRSVSSRDEVIAHLSALSPVILDVLPLSLEEVFVHEMEALGYNFDFSILSNDAKEGKQ